MVGDPGPVSSRLLREFAREPGRSVLARVVTPGRMWEDGVAVDDPHPAASLLKVPLAMSAELAFQSGRLDPCAVVPLSRLVTYARGPSVLRVLGPGLPLTAADVLGLCLAVSDRACAAWLLEEVGLAAVRTLIADLSCTATTATRDHEHPGGPLVGRTTARDALCLLAAALDDGRFPRTARALQNTVRDSRIPLGATGRDVRIAHKTGGLAGVAHDVAVLDCPGGVVSLAFLTEGQHDTLVSGYEMGICTRGLLRAWGLTVRRSRSLA